MHIRITLSFLLLIFLSGCDAHARSSRYDSAEPVIIGRFDQALFRYIESGDTTLRETLLRDYPQMLELTGKGILNMKSIDAPGFWNKLDGYYANPELRGIYRDALTIFENTKEIEKKLGEGFAFLTESFPAMKMPRVYMHISGFNQNVLTEEQTLSLSIDKYLGYDYTWYENFFYDYQRIKMQPERVVPDYLAGWLMSEYPFAGKENVLLERMIYEGKIKYLISRACPDISPAQLMGYTEEEYEFLQKNEAVFWKTIIERKHLYTPDHITTAQYFEDQPARFLSDNAPGQIGIFIGWQIIEHYMKETKNTPEQLIKAGNAQEILSLSRYKP